MEVQREEGVSPAQVQQTLQTARLFSEPTGITDVRQVRQHHIARFTDQLRRLPTSYGKSPKDRDRPIAEIIAEAADLPADRRGLGPATVTRHLRIVNRLLMKAGGEGIAVDRFLDTSAVRQRDTRRGRDKRDAFTPDDIAAIFRHPVFTGCKSEGRRRVPGALVIRDELYWLPILAALSGARREELAGMEARDVAQVDGIWCLHLRPNANRAAMKTSTSERTVPLHPELIALAFVDYARSVPQDGNLFPWLRRKSPNAGLGDSTAWLFDKVLDDQLGAERGAKSFHSFRNSVADRLTALEVEKDRAIPLT